MKATAVKRGAHGRRRRCPWCRKLQRTTQPGWRKCGDRLICPACAERACWRCFMCGTRVYMEPVRVTRDGAPWTSAPDGWLFAYDQGELTHVCSEACLTAVYERND